MASSSESLPFAHVDPPNKRSRPEVFSEAYWADDSEVLIEHTDLFSSISNRTRGVKITTARGVARIAR